MVEFLKIGKKEYPARIGYNVMKAVKQKTGKEWSEALKEGKEDLELHETILYAALQAGAYAEGQELDIKKEDIAFVLDLCFFEYMKLLSSDKFFPKEEVDAIEGKLKEAGLTMEEEN